MILFRTTILLLIFSTTLHLTASQDCYLRAVSGEPLEILSLETRAYIEGSYAQIEQIQVYKNPTDSPIETEYYFPRTDSSIFHRFEATIHEKVIIGKILEKEEAKKLYETNLEEGNTVAYSEQNSVTPDVMKILVGNIPARDSVTIKFSIIQPLDVVVNKFWSLTLPTVLTERYAPANFNTSDAPQITNVDQSSANYNDWKVYVEIKSDTPFEKLLNPSHKIDPTLDVIRDIRTKKMTYKAVWDTNFVPNKNFVIYYRPESLETANLVVNEHPDYPNDYVMLVNFVPQLNNLESGRVVNAILDGSNGLANLERSLLNEDIRDARAEFIFVIDRSGSMEGARILNLKRALPQFLQSLPEDSYFNIISYGTYFIPYSFKSLRYTPDNLIAVLEWIETIEADMGGTEILEPLKYATLLPPTDEYPRSVFLLTDGDIYNPDEVISLALDNSNRMRFSTVGIGNGASDYLLKNVAKVGGGVSEFVLDDEDIGEKAIYMIQAAVSQYIRDITFNVTCFDNNRNTLFQYDEQVDFILKDEPFQKWVYMQNADKVDRCDVSVRYFSSLKGFWMTEELETDGFNTSEKTDTWHKIAYDGKIKELDQLVRFGNGTTDKEELKKNIIELSIKYQVLCDYTAFFAVLEKKDSSNDEVIIRPQKISIASIDSADYDSGLQGLSSAPMYSASVAQASMAAAPAPASYPASNQVASSNNQVQASVAAAPASYPAFNQVASSNNQVQASVVAPIAYNYNEEEGYPEAQNCVVFYSDINQEGTSFQLCSSGDVPVEWNDQASSFRIPPNYSVTLYPDYSFGGQAIGPYNEGVYNIPINFNDQLSSVKISQDQTQVQPQPQLQLQNQTQACPIFYSDYSQKGASFQLCLSGNLPTVWNDRVSSFVVPRGYRVQLFPDFSFAGQVVGPYGQGSYNVPASLKDKVNSIRVNVTCPTFYSEYKQKGTSIQLCSSGDMPATWNAKVSSFIVPAGYIVRLYKDFRYRGETDGPYGAGFYDVPSGFNDQVSSVVVRRR